MIKFSNSQLEQFSKDILSDNKELRKQARASIIEHTASFQNAVVLSNKEKVDYPEWNRVSTQIQAMIHEEKFPYRVKKDEAGSVHQIFQIPNDTIISHSDFVNSNDPCYIVTMAHTPKLHLSQPLEYLAQQVNLLWNEGFGTTPTVSRAESSKRLAVVVGINYCHGIDNQENRRNKQYIANACTIAGSHLKIFAFNWRPVWKDEKGEIPQHLAKRLFRLLADANPKIAAKIHSQLMAKKDEIIPYQKIRNEIKNCAATVSFYANMRHGFEGRPSFLVSWDDDAIRLRTDDNMGLFSHYDNLISQNPDVEVATTGYYLVNAKEDFIELASRVDLIARQAIAHTLPNGCYFPEPNIIIRIITPEALKSRISFMRKKPNMGKNLEFLGLLENLNIMKGNVRKRVVFGKRGAIQTSQPVRAKIPKHMPQNLTPDKINSAKNLASLRMFCQSVLNPKKGFATSVARAMPTGTGSAKNTALISYLYTSFDPIDYIKKTLYWKVIYVDTCNALISIYNAKAVNALLDPNFTVRARAIAERANLDTLEQEVVETLLKDKFTKLWSACSLVTDRILSENQFLSLLITAINTNNAVYTFLASRIDQVPFEFPTMLDLN